MRHEDERKAKWPSVLWIGAILFGAALTAVYELRFEIREAIVRRVMGDALENFRNQSPPCIRCAGDGRVRKYPVRSMLPFGELPETINCPLCGGSGKAPSPWD